MLRPLSAAESCDLREFFEQSGYSEGGLKEHLGAAELPSRHLRNRARLLDRTSGLTPLDLLLRWFWLGDRQEQGLAQKIVPAKVLSILVRSGLLEQEGTELVPTAMLLHFDGFWVSSDRPESIESGKEDLVLWPNPTSKFLSRFAIRRHSRTTLDLGTGSGILSLAASRFSDKVTATDLNERAIRFALFNAALNGIENVEAIAGDCFVPVAHRRFDLVLSNPPFFITPQQDYLFCDNPMELDGLCRRLIKEAPRHLNEDGYMEMLCEWAQLKGQAWEERVAEWIDGTGCDAWVMKGLTQHPEEYAQHRIRETTPDTSLDGERYAGYMNYYRQLRVEAIHDGLIVLRRREGQNFVRIEEVPPTPSGNLGELILSTFAAHDFLRNNETDEELLSLRPAVAPDARLEQICIAEEGNWRAEAIKLLLKSGFRSQIDVQPLVAEFLSLCDGRKTAREAITEFVTRTGADPDKAASECLGMIRKLLARGFMVVAGKGESGQ